MPLPLLRQGTVVVVDDHPDICAAAKLALDATVQRVVTLRSPAELVAVLTEHNPDVVLLDMNFLPGDQDGAAGLASLQTLRALDPTLSVVCMTAFGEVSLAQHAIIQHGAVDFVMKPWRNEKLQATVRIAIALTRQRREALDLASRNSALIESSTLSTSEMLGTSPAMRHVLDDIQRAAPADVNVLILGETGTGKELAAREIHKQSPRFMQPFIAVDLGAVSDSLFESELFGHKRGAFTGAHADRQGKIRAAEGGTLFLDEITNLPLHLQRKLLSVLARREVTPLGSDRAIPVNIRLISATNRSASDLTDGGIFQQDLLYRIKTVELTLPPLRERGADILLLLDHFLTLYCRKHRKAKKQVSEEARVRLDAYSWPGNIRELMGVVERAVIMCSEERLGPDDFILAAIPARTDAAEPISLDAMEQLAIRKALDDAKGDVALAAGALGVTRQKLYRRIEKFGLNRRS